MTSAGPVHPRTDVEVGFFSFTEVLEGAHRSYNEWHMFDHLPEQLPIAGVVHGQRWVSTPACRDARAVSDDALDPIHYLTLYLMTAPVSETLAEFVDLGRRLAELGRFHRRRRSRLAGPLRLLSAHAAPRVLVSPAALPWRPHHGVFVVVERLDDDPPAAPEEEHVLAVLDLAGVAGVWSFGTDAALGELRHADGPRRVSVAWLDGPALEVTAAAGDRLLAGLTGRGGRVELAGPFETIVPWRWDWFDGGI